MSERWQYYFSDFACKHYKLDDSNEVLSMTNPIGNSSDLKASQKVRSVFHTIHDFFLNTAEEPLFEIVSTQKMSNNKNDYPNVWEHKDEFRNSDYDYCLLIEVDGRGFLFYSKNGRSVKFFTYHLKNKKLSEKKSDTYQNNNLRQALSEEITTNTQRIMEKLV